MNTRKDPATKQLSITDLCRTMMERLRGLARKTFLTSADSATIDLVSKSLTSIMGTHGISFEQFEANVEEAMLLGVALDTKLAGMDALVPIADDDDSEAPSTQRIDPSRLEAAALVLKAA